MVPIGTISHPTSQVVMSNTMRPVKIGTRYDYSMFPSKINQYIDQPRLVDNHGKLMSFDRYRYTAEPTYAQQTFMLSHKSGGSIHIKKKNKGKFTASAKAAGEGVQEHAHKVMNDPNATPLQKKRANFAIQAKKWHRKHQLGGKINYLDMFV